MVMQTHSCSGKNTRNLMEFTLCVSALKVAMFLNGPVPRRREILKLEDSGSPRPGHDLSFMVNMNSRLRGPKPGSSGTVFRTGFLASSVLVRRERVVGG